MGRILPSVKEEDDPLSFLGAREVAMPRRRSDVTDLSDLNPFPGLQDFSGRDLNGRELIPRRLKFSGTILDLRNASDDDQMAFGDEVFQGYVGYFTCPYLER
jgi:hypothetical protein